MKKALLITVGVGISDNKKEKVDSLSHGIKKSIGHNNPDHIVFITTEKSKKKTLPQIKKKTDLKSYETIKIKEFNDVNHIFDCVKDKITELKDKDYTVVTDFTSGTKAMSSGAVLASTSENCDLSYVGGKRVEGKVIKGEEKVQIFSPLKGIIDRQEKILKKLFNTYRFESGLEIIKELRQITGDPEIIKKLDSYQELFKGYSAWDQFKHKKAQIIKKHDNSLADITENKRFLSAIKNKENEEKKELIICDLYNNALRRTKEGKYDDAMARFYRLIEMIAQYELNKLDIDTSNLEIEDIKKHGVGKDIIRKWRQKRNQIGLKDSYNLLNDLNNGIGEKFKKDNELKNLLQKRNYSILAHGETPVKKEDTEKMKRKTQKYIKIVLDHRNFKKEIKRSKFPQL